MKVSSHSTRNQIDPDRRSRDGRKSRHENDSSAPRRPRTHSHATGNPLSTIRWSLQLRSYCRERQRSRDDNSSTVFRKQEGDLTTDHRLPILTIFFLYLQVSPDEHRCDAHIGIENLKQCSSFFILDLNGQSKMRYDTDDKNNNNMYLRHAYPNKQSPSDAYTGWTLLLDTDVL